MALIEKAAVKVSDTLGRRTATAVGWNVAARLVKILSQVVFLLVLGRTVSPELFGAAAAALLVFDIVTTLTTRTFTQALVQRHQWSSEFAASAFWLNAGLSIIVFLVAIAFAAIFSSASQDPRSFWMIAAISLAAPVSATSTISLATLSRDIKFGSVAASESVGSLTGFLLAMVVIYYGGGVFAVVVYSIGQRVVECFAYGMFAPAWPQAKPSRADGRELISFTLPLLGTHLVTTAVLYADQVFVGLVLGAEALGLYSLGRRLADQPSRLLVQALERALFPSAVSALRNSESAEGLYLNSLTWISLLNGVLFFGLAAVASTLLPLLLGPAWNGAAIFVSVFSFQSAIMPAGSVFLAFILAAGATRVQFWFTLSRLTISFGVTLALAWLLKWGAFELAVFASIVNIGLLLPQLTLVQRVTGLGSRPAVQAILLGLVPGALSGVVAFLAQGLPLAGWSLLFVQIFLGMISFLIACLIFHRAIVRSFVKRLL